MVDLDGMNFVDFNLFTRVTIDKLEVRIMDSLQDAAAQLQKDETKAKIAMLKLVGYSISYAMKGKPRKRDRDAVWDSLLEVASTSIRAEISTKAVANVIERRRRITEHKQAFMTYGPLFYLLKYGSQANFTYVLGPID